ncbi:MAG: hypothetical protein PHY80_05300, partial [Rickettsiales bacterium]|nr:hypothetical protein [Rickettsiales bacterium]
MSKVFKNKRFYTTFIIVLLILSSFGIYLHDKISINNNFLKFEENFLTNYSKDKFIEKTLSNIDIYNKLKIVKYIQIKYNSFLKSDLNLDNSIKDFTNTYDEASLILTNLKKIKAITEKD